MLPNAIPLSLAPVLPTLHMGRSVKTGKGPVADHPHASPHHTDGALKFARLAPSSLTPKVAIDWHKNVSGWGEMLNDQLGDCTCAAIGHMIQAFTAATGKQWTPQDSEILKVYEAVGGYQPGDSSTDRGAIEIDVLNWWRAVGLSGVKIDNFVALEPGNHDHVKLAIELFGGIYTGAALPSTAQNQPIWHPSLGGTEQGGANNDATPGSWGGHAKYIGKYDASGLYCITWGEEKKETWSWWDSYVDEAYAVLSELWCPKNGVSPSGYDYKTLMNYLGMVTG